MPTYSKTILLREGSVFKVNTVFNNREMLLKYEVVEWGEPLRASLKTETKGFEIVDTLVVMDLN